MSLSWHRRKLRLAVLLNSGGDEDEEGVALDRLTHGQNVIGNTSKTMEINSLRFSNQDLEVVGTLEVGQFGIIDLVTCRFNNCVYVRKSIEKISALRTREQCSPQIERDLLLQASKTQAPWAPHLLCAFQTPTHLSLIMDYAEGGTLWDVLESSPHDGRILETDLKWWIPQTVSAIHWCHTQGFAHRDVKPHNFVLTSDTHLLLIDFGSAAPLFPPNDDGSQLLPRQYCLIPCGTCDYISPEILQAHEAALVALEMEEDAIPCTSEVGEYGLETDWWSLGAMVYEMAYGVAPFFAPDIRSTYARIMNYEKSLRFDKNVGISHELQHFLRRLLTHAKKRLGRHNVMEITEHPFFEGVDWGNLPTQSAPVGLHLPHFVYSEPKTSTAPAPLISDQSEDTHSQGFPFSTLFQSSSASPGLSVLRPSPGPNSIQSHSSRSSAASFIGFSWGPTTSAFPEEIPSTNNLRTSLHSHGLSTPRTIVRSPRYFHQTLAPTNHITNLDVPLPFLPGQNYMPPEPGSYSTPMKPYSISPHATLPRTSTIRRTAPRRGVSDREAMKQLVDCVGMSARKKVLESGRKPKILNIFSSKIGTMRKELRFDELARPIPGPDYTRPRSRSRTNSTSRSFSRLIIGDAQASHLHDESDIYERSIALPDSNADANAYSSAETTDSEGGAPPSPSPSPRPGSATSMMSMTTFSRRSATPTASGFFGSTRRRAKSASVSRLSGTFQPPLSVDGSVTTTTASTTATTMATSRGQENFNDVHAEAHSDGQIGSENNRCTNVNVIVQDLVGDDWTSCQDQLNELGERHGNIMRDIRQLEHRLDHFLSLVEH